MDRNGFVGEGTGMDKEDHLEGDETMRLSEWQQQDKDRAKKHDTAEGCPSQTGLLLPS